MAPPMMAHLPESFDTRAVASLAAGYEGEGARRRRRHGSRKLHIWPRMTHLYAIWYFMYTYIYIYIYVYTYIYMYIHVYECVYIYIYIYIYVYMRICEYMCACVYIYIYIYSYTHIYIYIYIYIHMRPTQEKAHCVTVDMALERPKSWDSIRR